MNKHATSLDHESYLRTLVTDPAQVISRIYEMDGARLYQVSEDHQVIVSCSNDGHRHKGRPELERTLPRDWECFYQAVNLDEQFEVFHYGPAN